MLLRLCWSSASKWRERHGQNCYVKMREFWIWKIWKWSYGRNSQMHPDALESRWKWFVHRRSRGETFVHQKILIVLIEPCFGPTQGVVNWLVHQNPTNILLFDWAFLIPKKTQHLEGWMHFSSVFCVFCFFCFFLFFFYPPFGAFVLHRTRASALALFKLGRCCGAQCKHRARTSTLHPVCSDPRHQTAVGLAIVFMVFIVYIII